MLTWCAGTTHSLCTGVPHIVAWLNHPAPIFPHSSGFPGNMVKGLTCKEVELVDMPSGCGLRKAEMAEYNRLH